MIKYHVTVTETSYNYFDYVILDTFIKQIVTFMVLCIIGSLLGMFPFGLGATGMPIGYEYVRHREYYYNKHGVSIFRKLC